VSHRWVLDPIDGTHSFVHGVPFYGVLVGLEIDQIPLVGACYFPALDDMIAGAKGLGCFWNGRRATVSRATALRDACVAYTDARHIGQRLGAQWKGLLTDTALQRGWGDGYGHCLVATGRADLMLDPRMHAWDCAALIPILQEAGGRFTDWRGRVTIDGGDAVSSNGWLHDEALQRLRSGD
jgi:histidinol-phosphatase